MLVSSILSVHITTIMLGVPVTIAVLLILVIVIVTDGRSWAIQRFIRARVLIIGCYESGRIPHIPKPRLGNASILRIGKLASPIDIHLRLNLRPRINRQLVIRILWTGSRNIRSV